MLAVLIALMKLNISYLKINTNIYWENYYIYYILFCFKVE